MLKMRKSDLATIFEEQSFGQKCSISLSFSEVMSAFENDFPVRFSFYSFLFKGYLTLFFVVDKNPVYKKTKAILKKN